MNKQKTLIWDNEQSKYIETELIDAFASAKNRIAADKEKEYTKLMEQFCRKGADGTRNVFVIDGIIDKEKWGKDKKILFVLKEAYDKSSKSEDGLYVWDEPEWLLHADVKKLRGRHLTWKRIVAWSRIFLDGNYSDDLDVLRHIAIINVKKLNGESSSKNFELEENANLKDDDGEYLIKKQIEMIGADLIICGYTGWLLKDKLNAEPMERKYYLYKIGKVPMIDFWHPANRKFTDEYLETNLKIIKSQIEGGTDENTDEENETKE